MSSLPNNQHNIDTAALALASMAEGGTSSTNTTVVIAPYAGLGPLPVLPPKPRAPNKSILKGKIDPPASNGTKAQYKQTFKHANSRIGSLEKHVKEVYEKAVESHASSNNVLKHSYKALEKKQADLLKIVKEMNLQQVQVTEQKVRIETLQKDAVDRQQIIKKMYQRNDNLVKIAESLRCRYSALKRDRGSNIEEMKEAAVFKADIDLIKHKNKLEMNAEADDAKKSALWMRISVVFKKSLVALSALAPVVIVMAD